MEAIHDIEIWRSAYLYQCNALGFVFKLVLAHSTIAESTLRNVANSGAAQQEVIERKVRPRALVSSHWPGSSHCCFSVCYHIKVTVHRLNYVPGLPLDWHCDLLTCMLCNSISQTVVIQLFKIPFVRELLQRNFSKPEIPVDYIKCSHISCVMTSLNVSASSLSCWDLGTTACAFTCCEELLISNLLGAEQKI